jgi:hypothetical protein
MEWRLLGNQESPSSATYQPTSMHAPVLIAEGNPMSTEGTHQPDHEIVVRNTKKIAKLIHEVQKLVGLLEEQRLVEPAMLFQLKRELRDIQKAE